MLSPPATNSFKTMLYYVSFLLFVATSATFASAFQSSSGRLPSSVELLSRRKILAPHQKSIHQQQCSSSSINLISADVDVVAEWRQYVPLVVTGAVIIDILLGSPLANMALAPIKRATEEGASGGKNSINSERNANKSLFSGDSSSSSRGRTTKERVDSGAIAKAALFKATNTLELRRFLDENKTDEQKYEEVRKQIDRQMSELDE